MKTGPVTSPDFLSRAQRGLYSSIGAVCEDNTDTISARQVAVGLISGGATIFWGAQTHSNQPGNGAG